MRLLDRVVHADGSAIEPETGTITVRVSLDHEPTTDGVEVAELSCGIVLSHWQVDPRASLLPLTGPSGSA